MYITHNEIAVSHQMGLSNGMVIGVPIPRAAEAEASIVEAATAQAIEEAE